MTFKKCKAIMERGRLTKYALQYFEKCGWQGAEEYWERAVLRTKHSITVAPAKDGEMEPVEYLWAPTGHEQVQMALHTFEFIPDVPSTVKDVLRHEGNKWMRWAFRRWYKALVMARTEGVIDLGRL